MTDTELRTAQVDEHSIAYREAGRGAVLILLHGFLCDSRCWMRQLRGLSDQFRVVAWDAPGAGLSSDPPETFTTTDYARCLAGFLDEIAMTSAHVVGLSWGGILAQELYRVFPERVRSLVLADTYAGWKGSLPEPVWRERLETCLRDSTGPADALVAKLLPGMFTDGVPEEVREELGTIMSEFHPVGFRVMSRSCADMDTRDLLPRIDVPTLVLWGDDDRRSPLHIAKQLHTAIPNAELAVIPQAGHLSNMEQPDAFNAHVHRFCLERDAA
ncbi:MAG TPA: alpha/beta fold hydrolase [Actinomycetota bacterium]|nr:alpha/beta fold hydrolase [Actinomycetota bacterium]